MSKILRNGWVTLCMLSATGVWAADRYVAQNGQTPDPAGQFTSWENAASNIQAAATAAASTRAKAPMRFTTA